MLLSAGFHLFFCHSEKACRRWLAMDLAGISIGIFGCYLPAVHLAFYCHQVRYPGQEASTSMCSFTCKGTEMLQIPTQAKPTPVCGPTRYFRD